MQDRFRYDGRLDEIVGLGARAAAEAAAGKQHVELDLLGLEPGDLRQRGLVPGLELLAVPDFAAVGVELDHAVHRLHRRVCEERKLVGRLELLRGTVDAFCRVAVVARDLPGSPRELAVLGRDVGGRRLEARGVVPVDLERIAPLLRLPERRRDDRDSVGHLDHVAHARDLLHARDVVALELSAEARRMRDDGGQHLRKLDVLRVLRGAVRLGLGIGARHVLADEDEVLRLLELHRCRHGLLRGRVRKFAEGGFLPVGVEDDAVLHLNRVGRHAPLFCRGGHEHRARRGAGLPVLLERVGDRGRAAGSLRGAPHQVGVARRIGGCADRANLRPRGVELLGDERRESGVGALAHLEMLHVNGDRIVGADRHERVRLEGAGGGGAGGLARSRFLRSRAAGPETQREAGAGGGRCLEKATAVETGRGDEVTGTHAHRVHGGLRSGERLRRFVDRGANPDIGRAAADVSGHRFIDVGVGRILLFREQRCGRHHLPDSGNSRTGARRASPKRPGPPAPPST